MIQAPDFIPAPLRDLWTEAACIVARLMRTFDHASLIAGIRRAAGVRLQIKLNAAESALRRLILIVALTLTPAPLKPSARQPAARTTTQRPHSFTVFRLRGAGAPTRRHISSYRKDREPTLNTHIRFPADPLLSLNRKHAPRPTHRHNGGPVLPRPTPRHPLDRWVRLSRNDPDWRPPEPQPAITPLDYRVVRDHGPSPRARPQRHDSTADWRRCYDEWEKLVPAPHLAARLEALQRIAEHPEALIRRTARRLQHQPERTRAQTRTLARAARPNTALPRRARRVNTAGYSQAIAIAVHDLFDSS